MDWFLYDNGLRHERVNNLCNCGRIYPQAYIKLDYRTSFKIFWVNPLSANTTKWSITLKQLVSKLPTNCLSVLNHFVGLVLKGLKIWKQRLTVTALIQIKLIRLSKCLHKNQWRLLSKYQLIPKTSFWISETKTGFLWRKWKVTLLKNFFRILQVSCCQKFFEVIWCWAKQEKKCWNSVIRTKHFISKQLHISKPISDKDSLDQEPSRDVEKYTVDKT